jgi:hypothetical protein
MFEQNIQIKKGFEQCPKPSSPSWSEFFIPIEEQLA